jgi:hypothetical protein
LADKSSQLVLEALSRAALDPDGLPLFGQKAAPGLFAGGTLARNVAQRCKDQDLLRVVRTETRGKSVREVVTITPKGLDHLLNERQPRQVLEDLVRAVEARKQQLGDWIASARQTQASFDALRKVVGTVLERIATPAAPALDCGPAIAQTLKTWAAGNAAEDCPLPHVFRELRTTHPTLTIGTFHDELRRLHQEQRLWLHPWTGPLYDLPEPPLALLVGHEIAYYASARD